MITDQQYTDWLSDQSAIRVLLIEADCQSEGLETTRYMSPQGFVTKIADVPSNKIYEPIVSSGFTFAEEISLNSTASLSFSEITIFNHNGVRDSWLDDIWINRSIRIYFGDARWERSDFKILFKLVCGGISSSSRHALTLNISEIMQRLNAPVSELTVGGDQLNKDRLQPLTFGECFNVTPVLVNHRLHKVHVDKIEDVIEGRDGGLPVLIDKYLFDGEFEYSNPISGQATCSVQGDKTPHYINTIADIIKKLATQYGKESLIFSENEIDQKSFDKFTIYNHQPVGIHIANRTNVINAITELASSVGGQVIPSRTGQLRLIKIELPLSNEEILPPVNLVTQLGSRLAALNGTALLSKYGETRKVLSEENMVDGGLTMTDRLDVIAAVSIGYCRNWTPQSNLIAGVPDEHQEFFTQEWITKTSSDIDVKTKYRLDQAPLQKETLLLRKEDAEAEAYRLLDMYSNQRSIYTHEGYIDLIETNLGDEVILKHQDFGLKNGKVGLVVRVEINLQEMRVKLGVLA